VLGPSAVSPRDPEVAGEASACPGEKVAALIPISEGGPGVRGQRPRDSRYVGLVNVQRRSVHYK
jgi:hypothetical protein